MYAVVSIESDGSLTVDVFVEQIDAREYAEKWATEEGYTSTGINRCEWTRGHDQIKMIPAFDHTR